MSDDPGLLRPPPIDPPLPAGQNPDDEEMPRIQLGRRELLLGIFFIVSIVAFLYVVLPQISGLEDTWEKIEDGDPWWLAIAGLFTILSFGGYVMLFQGV